jgi:hypothetical protein
MVSRPYEATIKLRCTARGCNCEITSPARLYESAENSQMIERSFKPYCETCGHGAGRHATANVEKHKPIERRVRPR